ncbi:DUF1772 domain-containing protein [Dyadobacter sp. CY345]|uniref:anthrone oxygenase family protein n=1 Tax=Dyadobacter sp. CY345 TaxID=2909335 RepID=UPI001F162936|nr:anthrone oxygenase family protein [Dyadobacter sp. CY345]MCF2446830.1 DUF1772 domain-containing protein [Dyadobacter sp. CY345]
MMSFLNFILVLATLATALIAGLFYAYSCSVNPGLSELSDSEYIKAMQSINIAIVNPVFLSSFLGTLLLLPLSTYFVYQDGLSDRFWLLFAATLLYWIGTFGVTIFGNIPLNDALADFNTSAASAEAVSQQRGKFELPWNRLHQIRTIASFSSLTLAIIACVLHK